ncbi:MAG: hypothetical protein E6H87_02095 [Chloroflexi bacterium]|nr:MAG: hypothetical protein E6I14_02220 [Chloroflexota bacterium]TMG63434.1 MAG: hypothetical protein E6H87_02095 [Chloroflexota bacterium]
MLYFFTTGTNTPLLALLSLRRPRNLAPILLGYAGLGVVAVIVGDPVVAILALSPSPLIGPSLARFVAVRAETVGALLTGTIVLSFPLLMAAIPGLGPSVNIALFAFVIGTALAGSLPTLRDVLLPVFDGARYVAMAIILGGAALSAVSLVDLRAVGVAALVLLVGVLTAASGAILFGGNGIAAAIGAGTRDPAVAAALAMSAGLAGAGSVPLAYAALLALSLGVGKLLVARQA